MEDKQQTEMMVSAIVAAAKNRVIGHHNSIPWYLSDDLKFFKKTTSGHHVIMGRKSFLSIGRPLPKRTNIIVTRDAYFTATGCLVAHSIENALGVAYDNGEKEAFIIGGGEIYRQSAELWDRLYYTEVDAEPDGDVFFPELDWSEWKLTTSKSFEKSERNDHNFVAKTFDRIQD